MVNKNLVRAIKLIVGISIFAVFILWVGTHDVIVALGSFNLIYLIPALLLFISTFFINTLKLQILLAPLKNLTFLHLFKKHLFSWAAGFLLPGKVGEFSLSYLLRKEVPVGESSAVLVLDKVVSFTTFLIFAIAPLFYFFGFERAIYLVSLFMVVSLPLGFFVFTNTGRSIIKRTVLRKHHEVFKGFSKTLHQYIKEEKKIIAIDFILTATRLIALTLVVWFLFLGFNQQVDIIFLLFASAVVTIISLIPITPGGLGIRQVSMAFLLGHIGVPYATTISVALINLSIRYSTILLISYQFLSKGLKQL
jgi:hypothetical protein